MRKAMVNHSWIRSLARITFGAFILASLMTGCSFHSDRTNLDRDGTTAVTRDKNSGTNYGSSAGSTDRQAEDNKVDLMKYKHSF